MTHDETILKCALRIFIRFSSNKSCVLGLHSASCWQIQQTRSLCKSWSLVYCDLGLKLWLPPLSAFFGDAFESILNPMPSCAGYITTMSSFDHTITVNWLIRISSHNWELWRLWTSENAVAVPDSKETTYTSWIVLCSVQSLPCLKAVCQHLSFLYTPR